MVGVLGFAAVSAIKSTVKRPRTVQNVVGKDLGIAKKLLKSAGLEADLDKDEGLFGVTDESSRFVCAWNPAPETKTKDIVRLDVRNWHGYAGSPNGATRG